MVKKHKEFPSVHRRIGERNVELKCYSTLKKGTFLLLEYGRPKWTDLFKTWSEIYSK